MIDPVTGERLSDERLCWLAVRDRLRHRSIPPQARTGFGEVLSFLVRLWHSISTRIVFPRVYRDERSDRMADLAFIVDELSTRLTAPERQTLRRTGEVPEWFLPAVETTYAQRRR